MDGGMKMNMQIQKAVENKLTGKPFFPPRTFIKLLGAKHAPLVTSYPTKENMRIKYTKNLYTK
jgi:hypothetical protein